VADLKVMVWVRALRSGILDYVPTDLPDKLAPKLVEHLDRVLGHPKVAEYYARSSSLSS
jgi:glutathione S-transferase